MNPNIPSIEQLKELGLPAPVSYAPQTWGWWVLLGFWCWLLCCGCAPLLAMAAGCYRREAWRVWRNCAAQ